MGHTREMPPAAGWPAADDHPGAVASGEPREDATSVAAVRLRTPADLASSWPSSFQGPAEQAQFFVELHRSDPEAAHRLANAVIALPEVGTEFLGFRLLAELGQGAFGRVYLAQQGDLADRSVVLKLSPSIGEESRTLAQLQHTNIVPVYSVHRAGPLQAVCMPHFGSTTLAHLVKDIKDRESLPQSGRELVQTIVNRKSTLHEHDTHYAGPARPVVERAARHEPAGAESAAGCDPVCVPGAAGAEAGTSINLAVLQGFSYVEAVLWIGSRLADGLAHAHERGIVHRDLKPANILLTDDGQPMLLDFNLAQDMKLHNRAALALVGGTLPFMAPEQIEAYRSETVLLDYRSDIYSLGVVLFELLTGQSPFPSPTGPIHEVLQQMVRDRRGPLPGVCCWNKAVTPAVESIIRHCLEPDLDRRYQNARQLKEDLDRHLEDLPLRHAPEPSLPERARKWRRRHPRLASTTTVAVVAGLLIAALVNVVLARGVRLAEVDARDSLGRFLAGKKTAQYLVTARMDQPAQLDEGIQQGREVLDSFGILDGRWQDRPTFRRLSPANQDLMRRNAAELLLLVARGTTLHALNQGDLSARQEGIAQALELNRLAEGCLGSEHASRALWVQRAELTRRLGRDEEAKRLQARALATPLRTAADYYLVAVEHTAQGRFKEALPLLAQATEIDSQDYWAWLLRGVCHDRLSQSTQAIACYDTCIALAPESYWGYLNRGLTRLRKQEYQQASDDLERVLALCPDHVEACKNRALARQGLKQYAEAIRGLTRTLELDASLTHVYFLRAAARERAGDLWGAKKDREQGLRRQPANEMDWLARGYARMSVAPRAALDDFDQALKINPRSQAALQNKAHVLSKLGRNEEAAKVLDKVVEHYPDFVLGRAGRGVLLARVGKREAAHKDALACLARDKQPLTCYQLAGIYALTSKTSRQDRKQAFRLLSLALLKGVGFDLLETDRDLDPIRQLPEFKRLVAAARAIRATANGTDNQ